MLAYAAILMYTNKKLDGIQDQVKYPEPKVGTVGFFLQLCTLGTFSQCRERAFCFDFLVIYVVCIRYYVYLLLACTKRNLVNKFQQMVSRENSLMEYDLLAKYLGTHAFCCWSIYQARYYGTFVFLLL